MISAILWICFLLKDAGHGENKSKMDLLKGSCRRFQLFYFLTRIINVINKMKSYTVKIETGWRFPSVMFLYCLFKPCFFKFIFIRLKGYYTRRLTESSPSTWEQDNSPPDNCPPQMFFSFIFSFWLPLSDYEFHCTTIR
jgi:hypothetical protein